jgi:hypothetical protein
MYLRRIEQKQNIGKTNNFKVFESMKTKGPQQDSQNRLKSPMGEGGRPNNK